MEYQYTFEALKRLGVVGFNVRSDNTVEYADGVTAPSDADIAAKVAEIKAEYPLNKLRSERNRRLAETDWWAVGDRTMTQAQKDYRQALRDITNQFSSTSDAGFSWPVKPEE